MISRLRNHDRTVSRVDVFACKQGRENDKSPLPCSRCPVCNLPLVLRTHVGKQPVDPPGLSRPQASDLCCRWETSCACGTQTI